MAEQIGPTSENDAIDNMHTVFPQIVSALEYFPSLNTFRGQNLLKINSFRP
jgi:hypothetical protein